MHFDLQTLALQTVNVLVLVWLLARFLFRPVAGIIADRRAAADAVLAEAEGTRAKVAADAALLTQQRQALTGDGEHIIAAARASAESERAAIMRQADDSIRKAHDEAEQAITRERQAMREALRHEATDLAMDIAKRLLARLPSQVLDRAFLTGLDDVLATHPARASLAGSSLEVRSAAPLDPAVQADCRDVLVRLIGNVPSLTFRTDPTLIAGIELASRDLVIRNSWQADLEHLTSALHEDTDYDVAPQHVA
jgi:F-type H+-transporting ATPase subunit b